MAVSVIAAASWTDWVSLGIGVLALASFVVTMITLRQGLEQIRHARRSIDAGLAAEVRQLNLACRTHRGELLNGFPLHRSLVELYPSNTWQLLADGQYIGEAETHTTIEWLLAGRHPAVRIWNDSGDLTDGELDNAGRVVGYLNDLCQMMSDGTPGHFIFQQYHQTILMTGVLVLPLVYERQHGARWGARLPSLVNRAAIYHRVRPTHTGTVVKLRRVISRDGLALDGAAAAAERLELLIPLVGTDGTTGSIHYDDVLGRSIEVDYEAFERYFREWEPPDPFHHRQRLWRRRESVGAAPGRSQPALRTGSTSGATVEQQGAAGAGMQNP